VLQTWISSRHTSQLLVMLQEDLGFRQAGAVNAVLKVKVDRVQGCQGVPSQGRFAVLPGSEDDRRRSADQGAL